VIEMEGLSALSAYACRVYSWVGLGEATRDLCSLTSDPYTAGLIGVGVFVIGLWAAVRALASFHAV
jgi:hypothetical protein